MLAAFQVEDMPSPAALAQSVADDIEHLAKMQNYDGGFGWWSRSYDYGPRSGSAPFLTVHVTHALARAIEKGYAPQDNMVSQARSYLENIESHLDEWDITGEARNAITAYALYTRMLLGERDAAKAREVFARPGERDVNTLGWLHSRTPAILAYERANGLERSE